MDGQLFLQSAAESEWLKQIRVMASYLLGRDGEICVQGSHTSCTSTRDRASLEL